MPSGAAVLAVFTGNPGWALTLAGDRVTSGPVTTIALIYTVDSPLIDRALLITENSGIPGVTGASISVC